jgi:hypothetical protein
MAIRTLPRATRSLISPFVLICLLPMLAACSAETQEKPQPDFQTYWSNFRSAVLANRKEDVASMTRFPFVEKGMVPGIEAVSHSRESFLALWDKLMNQDSGAPSQSMRQLIEVTKTVNPRNVAPSGRTAQIGMFEFEKTEKGWRLTGAFLSD